MTIRRNYQVFQNRQQLNFIITGGLLLLIAANVLLDFSFTWFKNSSFYLSESLLFSSYWLLFLPLLTFLFSILKQTQKTSIKSGLVGLATLFHLFLYPALVWVISKTACSHTCGYWQTFNFGLSAYCIKTILIYGFSVGAFTFLNNKSQHAAAEKRTGEKTEAKIFINALLVTDNNNKKLLLQTTDIFYFSANSPYIEIYHSSRKYLHAETLKSLEMKLDNRQFIRIHKSHIVNLAKIILLQSRQNGDYDITLSDNTVLRVSRNYARNFKAALEQYTQLTIK